MKGFNALQEKMLGDKNVAIGQVSYALACADRHTGPSTTSISLAWFPLRGSLINDHGQPTALTTPCTLASGGYLELRLDSGGDWVCNDEIGRFWRSMLQRLPNLVYASLSLSTLSKAPMVPLLQLKHLELSLQTLDGLACMPFGACLPSLETASIKASFQPWPDRIGFISELNVLGCTHLRPAGCERSTCVQRLEAGTVQAQARLAEIEAVLCFSGQEPAAAGSDRGA